MFFAFDIKGIARHHRVVILAKSVCGFVTLYSLDGLKMSSDIEIAITRISKHTGHTPEAVREELQVELRRDTDLRKSLSNQNPQMVARSR